TPKQRIIATASESGDVDVWRFQSVPPLTEHLDMDAPYSPYQLERTFHVEAAVHCVIVTEDEEVLFGDGEGQLWIASLESRHPRRIAKFDSPILSLAIFSNGQFLALATGSGEVIVWDLDLNTAKARHMHHIAPVTCVVVTRKGRHVYSSSYDGRIVRYDIKKSKADWIVEGHTKPIWSIALSPSSESYLASAGWDKKVCIWDIGSALRVESINHPSAVCAVAWQGQMGAEDRLITGGEDARLRTFDTDPNAWYRIVDEPQIAITQVKMATLALLETVEESGTDRKFTTMAGGGKTFYTSQLIEDALATDATLFNWGKTETVISLPSEGRGRFDRELLVRRIRIGIGGLQVPRSRSNSVDVVALIVNLGSGVDLSVLRSQMSEASRQFPSAPLKVVVASLDDQTELKNVSKSVQELAERIGFNSVLWTGDKRDTVRNILRRDIKRLISWDDIPIVSVSPAFIAFRRVLLSLATSQRPLATYSDLRELMETGPDTDLHIQDLEPMVERLIRQGLVKKLDPGDKLLLDSSLLDEAMEGILQRIASLGNSASLSQVL
ncbi:MAG: hypothetical protein V3T31_04605, partial [candidate division Zixibacteria bacterium]